MKLALRLEEGGASQVSRVADEREDSGRVDDREGQGDAGLAAIVRDDEPGHVGCRLLFGPEACHATVCRR